MLTVPPCTVTFLSWVLVPENASVPAPVFVISPPPLSPLTVPPTVKVLPLATSTTNKSSACSLIVKLPLKVAVSVAFRYLTPEVSVRIVTLLPTVMAEPNFSVAA